MILGSTKVESIRVNAVLKHSIVREADLIVNATSLGLHAKDHVPITPKMFGGRKRLFMDLIYNPRRTKLISEAKRLGHKVSNGESMLLYQGARAFQLWTGRRAPLSTMKKALKNAL